MTTYRVDAKGKIYTDTVRKEKLPMIMQTLTNVIHGYVFVRPEQRVKDALNEHDEDFIAVAGAEVFSPNGQLVQRAEFLTVNKRHIVWLKPDEAQRANRDQPSG